jgi:hypothetical protein
MPLRTGFPRTTHQWLLPLYAALDLALGYIVPSGASGIANGIWLGRGVPQTQVGTATGVVGLYGFTGLPAVTGYGFGNGVSGFTSSWSGASGIMATGVGGSGLASALSQLAFNGGTGSVVSINEIVRALKNVGIITP